MAKHQHRTHKRNDKKSRVSSVETVVSPSVNRNSNTNISATTVKSQGQGITAESNNQEMIIRDIKKIGILTGVIIVIVIILANTLPRLLA